MSDRSGVLATRLCPGPAAMLGRGGVKGRDRAATGVLVVSCGLALSVLGFSVLNGLWRAICFGSALGWIAVGASLVRLLRSGREMGQHWVTVLGGCADGRRYSLPQHLAKDEVIMITDEQTGRVGAYRLLEVNDRLGAALIRVC